MAACLTMFDRDTLVSPACASICNFPSRSSPPIMTAAQRLFPNFKMAWLAATPDGVRLGGIQLLTAAATANFEQDDNGNAPGEVAEQFSRQTAVSRKACSSATSYDSEEESASPTLTPRPMSPAPSLAACLRYTFSTMVPEATQLGTARRHGSKPTHMHIGCLSAARRKALVMISFMDIYAKVSKLHKHAFMACAQPSIKIINQP